MLFDPVRIMNIEQMQKSSTNAHSNATVTSHFFMLPGVCMNHPESASFFDRKNLHPYIPSV